MQSIYHKIARVTQKEAADCVQANTSQFLSFYGIQKSIEEIKKDVPVYIRADGTPLGSSLGHIAAYMIDLCSSLTMHIADTDLFDQSWITLEPNELVEKLKARQAVIKHINYDRDALTAISEGYVLFLNKGGKIVFPVVDVEYIYNFLQKGPVYAVLNYQFAFQRPKFVYSQTTKEYEEDSINGSIATHALLIIGYKEGKFCLLDPDNEESHDQERWVDANRVVGSYYLAGLNIVPLLITTEK